MKDKSAQYMTHRFVRGRLSRMRDMQDLSNIDDFAAAVTCLSIFFTGQVALRRTSNLTDDRTLWPTERFQPLMYMV